MYREHKRNVNEARGCRRRGCWSVRLVPVRDLFCSSAWEQLIKKAIWKSAFSIWNQSTSVRLTHSGEIPARRRFWHQIAGKKFHYVCDKSQGKYSERFHISPFTHPHYPHHPHQPFFGKQCREKSGLLYLCIYWRSLYSLKRLYNSIKFVSMFKKIQAKTKNNE